MKGANYGLFLLVFGACVILSQAYKELSVESPELCSPNSKKRIKLSSGSRSGLVVKQKRLGDHSIEWLQNSICKFEVRLDHRTRKSEGIFAVVQQIVFRKDEQTGECIDFVQFKRQDGVLSKKFCGRSNAALSMDSVFLNQDDSEEDDDVRIANNSFDDHFGELDVYIFVAKEPLLSHEETDISIVFTAYKPCPIGYGLESRPCNEELPDKCIYSGFFRDGYYNCPYMNCLDEGDCSYMQENTTVEKESIGNKVLISSVTSLLIMFILFVCCIYMCRKYGTLCWAEEFARSNPTAVQSPPRNIQLTTTVTETAASAPAPEQATSTTATAPTADDKDLPPSYESLFPTR